MADRAGQDRRDYPVFVETGTWVGATTLAMQSHFREIHTVEIAPEIRARFLASNPPGHVRSYLGDSTDVLPGIITALAPGDQCVFWLDGHWSSGDTGRGVKDCPLIEECHAIDTWYAAERALILIDDVRLFGTTAAEDWSGISMGSITRAFQQMRLESIVTHGDRLALLAARGH